MDLRLNFVPKMNPQKLIDGYRSILKRIYDETAEREHQHAQGPGDDLGCTGRAAVDQDRRIHEPGERDRERDGAAAAPISAILPAQRIGEQHQDVEICNPCP